MQLSAEPAAIYAIGDVHGCLDRLVELERRIVVDATSIEGPKLLILLGDLVDRGPDSAGVLDHLCAPPPAGFHRTCLRGNHEEALLAMLANPTWSSAWLDMGGRETLRSYGFLPEGNGRLTWRERQALMEEFAQAIPLEHRALLEEAPLAVETPRYFFTHAGIRPGVDLASQAADDLMSIRKGFVDYTGPPAAKLIVHGHTPTVEPVISPFRVGLDTGAYLGGPLTAARLMPEGVTIIAVP